MVLFFLSQKNLLYFECQTRDVSKDLVDGETVSQQHLLQVSSHFQLFAQAPGRTQEERGKTFIPHLDLQSYCFS